MANNHIISIEKPAKLSIDLGRLKISFTESGEEHCFSSFDIAVLILSHTSILLSSAVSKELSSTGAIIIYVGDNYMPIGITLPIGKNLNGAKRPHQQAKYSVMNLTKPWWRQIIKSKILGQASVLDIISKEHSQRLYALSNNIVDGDEDNKEGQAARFYWEIYFSKLNLGIKGREKQGATDIVNASLNYAYAIIRSMIARSLSTAGLCLNFGIGHSRKDNPFNLVEDFIEPFRYIADKIIFNIFSNSEYKALDSKLKKEILSNILKETVSISGKNYRLFEAIDFMINSFCNTLDDPRRKLYLPNMQPSKGVKADMQELNHIKYEV